MEEILAFLKDKRVYYRYEYGDKYHPILATGLHAEEYFNFSRLNDYSSLNYFLQKTFLLEKLALHVRDVDVVCGVAYGGIFPATVIGCLFNLPVIYTDKSVVISERFQLGGRVLLIDDVVVTGETIVKFLRQYRLHAYPYIVSLVSYRREICFSDVIYKVIAAFYVENNVFREENCPLCGRDSLPVDPKQNWDLLLLHCK